jgi:hypothetical protein
MMAPGIPYPTPSISWRPPFVHSIPAAATAYIHGGGDGGGLYTPHAVYIPGGAAIGCTAAAAVDIHRRHRDIVVGQKR